MGIATEEKPKKQHQAGQSLMWGCWSGEDIFSIYFRGPAKDLLQFLKDFEENIGAPYFGWNNEFWDESEN